MFINEIKKPVNHPVSDSSRWAGLRFGSHSQKKTLKTKKLPVCVSANREGGGLLPLSDWSEVKGQEPRLNKNQKVLKKSLKADWLSAGLQETDWLRGSGIKREVGQRANHQPCL